MNLEGPSDNFKNYSREDKNIQEEKQVGDMLVELRAYLPGRITATAASAQELTMGRGREVETWVHPFVNHPDRIEWLRNFVNEAKEKMQATLPEGTDVNVIKPGNWREFYAHMTTPSGPIFEAGRNIRDEFLKKVWSFGDEDTKEKPSGEQIAA